MQECKDSVNFLKDGHEFMAKSALPTAAEHYPDGYAVDFRDGMMDGIKEYLDDHPSLSDNYKVVLEFADTHFVVPSYARVARFGRPAGRGWWRPGGLRPGGKLRPRQDNRTPLKFPFKRA